MRTTHALALAAVTAISAACGAIVGATATEGSTEPTNPDGGGGSSEGGGSGGEGGGDAAGDAACATCSRYVFVSKALVGATSVTDAQCQTFADQGAAPIAGRTFVVWRSSDATAAKDTLVHGATPYVLPSGTKVASSWTELTSGTLEHPIDEDETGQTPMGASTSVWTGTDSGGDTARNSGVAQDCAGWTTTDGSHVGAWGAWDHADALWTFTGAASATTCNTTMRIYCIER